MTKHLSLPFLIICAATQVSAQESEISASAASQISAIHAEKAARTPVERKLDSQLLYFVREAGGKQAVSDAPGLRSRVASEPDGRVVVDISAAPSAELREAITAAGGAVLYESPRWSSVRASVGSGALMSLAARSDVKRIARGALPSIHAVTNESDSAHKAAAMRPFYGVSGVGIKVGVLSDSVDHLEGSLASGELPASLTVLPGRSGVPASGEGTAMLEIIHDIAPGAQLYFATAGPGKAGFAESITMLRAAGCRIIVDDISYSTAEWQFQDDEIGQAVNQVVDDGALYFSSAGNEGNLKYGTSTTWEGNFSDGGAASAPLSTGRVHSFGTQNFNRVTEGDSRVVLQWSDEYHTSANDYDLFVLSADGSTVIASSTDTQDGSQAPLEWVEAAHPGDRIVIWKAPAAAARYLRVISPGSKLEVQTAGQTIGHAATAKCICVAASDATLAAPSFTAASLVEESSSDGPHKMFYRPDGTPFTPGNFLATGGITLQTPSITGGDGGATSVPGFANFYGTSAAAPAAAAIAALVWSRAPDLTNSQVRTLLESSCIDIEGPGFEVNSGNGILMADLALTGTRTAQESWRFANFGLILPSGDAAPVADPDHDGLPNRLEYATGSDPLISGASPFAAVSRTGNSVSIGYHRNPSATDAVLQFEQSSTLATGSWTPIVPDTDVLQSTQDGVQLRSAVFSSSSPRNFVRLRITTP